MALRSGYKGFKKLLPGLKLFRPGTLGIDNDVLIQELNKTFFPRSEQAVLGAKNFLQNTATSNEINGITWTVNADGTVKANGTATADSYLAWDYTVPVGLTEDINEISKKTRDGYTISSCSDADTNKYYCGAGTNGRVYIVIKNGTTVSNKIFYPMIRLATDPDDTYVPYAMTNKQLTDIASVVKRLTDIASDNTIASTAPISSLTSGMLYMIAGSDSGNPFSGYNLGAIVYKISSNAGIMFAWKNNNSADVSSNVLAYRICYNDTWSHWAKITGTDVS